MCKPQVTYLTLSSSHKSNKKQQNNDLFLRFNTKYHYILTQNAENDIFTASINVTDRSIKPATYRHATPQHGGPTARHTTRRAGHRQYADRASCAHVCAQNSHC